MAEVERTSIVFHDGKVQGLETEGGRVAAVVGGDHQLRAPEAGLDVIGGGGEDGCI